MNEARELGIKLKDAENELQKLRSDFCAKDSTSPNTSRISELQEAKEALGTKLRKYAAHIKQMDQERSLAFHTMKKVLDRLDEDDLVGSVSSLCEKLNALEEECDALSSVEGRAAGYLVESEQLRDKNGALQKQLSETESRLNELLKAKADLQLKLEESNLALASLQHERDELRALEKIARGSASELESEKSRQISYLEKENLQLMLELKNVKREAQNLRSEIGAFRNGNREITEDLGGISSEILRAKVFEFEKENMLHGNIDATDKTINRNGPVSCEKKASAKKTRLAMSSHHISALGQSRVDDDTTGECKQS